MRVQVVQSRPDFHAEACHYIHSDQLTVRMGDEDEEERRLTRLPNGNSNPRNRPAPRPKHGWEAAYPAQHLDGSA